MYVCRYVGMWYVDMYVCMHACMYTICSYTNLRNNTCLPPCQNYKASRPSSTRNPDSAQIGPMLQELNQSVAFSRQAGQSLGKVGCGRKPKRSLRACKVLYTGTSPFDGSVLNGFRGLAGSEQLIEKANLQPLSSYTIVCPTSPR